jgi:crossover junction endodeoxyribonuclease RuvC
MSKAGEKIILGIDPGSLVTGYGVIAVSGKTIRVLDLGVFKMGKVGEHFDKLKVIFDNTGQIIQKFQPDEFAVEAPFYGNNVQSMLKLGRAQGVAIAAALHANLPVFEYAPRKVKQAITGNGAASKEQVAALLKQMYGITIDTQFLDATDGLAVAVCHGFRNDISSASGKTNSWEAFLKKNPERLK